MPNQHIPDAPPALRVALRELHQAGALTVTQHITNPRPDEWYGGDTGPYATAERALVGGVRWLRGLYEDAARERDEFAEEARQLRAALAALQAERKKP